MKGHCTSEPHHRVNYYSYLSFLEQDQRHSSISSYVFFFLQIQLRACVRVYLILRYVYVSSLWLGFVEFLHVVVESVELES